MSPNLWYVLLVGVLFAAGVALLLERSLTRVVMGVILLGNGANLLILTAGTAGGAPIVGTTPDERMSDPLPHAMILTAIVITFGMTAFLLAMAYRSWYLTGHDEVQDDVEDRRIMRRAEQDQDWSEVGEDEGPEPAAAPAGAAPAPADGAAVTVEPPPDRPARIPTTPDRGERP